MQARRLPRLSSDPYREDYDKTPYNKNKFRSFSHRSDSPEGSPVVGGSMLSKGLRPNDRDNYKYRKSNRDDRDRDRSPREKNWGYKDKPREKEVERLTTFGDWSEHKSSSGKRYYYNCKTEVSQWEKPREWLDFQRSRQANNEKPPDWRDRGGPSTGVGRGGDGRGEARGSDGRGGEGRGGEGRGGGSDENHRPTPAKLHCDRTLRGSQDKHSSSPLSSRGREGRGGGTDRSGDATPTSEGEGGNHHHYPGGAVSLSAAIPRISTQHSVSGLSRERWDSPRSTISQSPPASSSEQILQQAVVSPLLQLQTSMVTLTPSLARLHREDLISHVQGWPADQLERGCHRLGEEAHQISSHGITRVSAELKMARSLVRLAEIQATLQEQRILFLRQQMIDMERHTTTVTIDSTTSSFSLTNNSHVPTKSPPTENHR